MKECSKCNTIKSFDCFRLDKKNKSGLRSQCKDCDYEIYKKWVLNNKDKIKEYNKKHSKKRVDKAKTIVREKRTQNVCLNCSASLFDKILSARYCDSCKKEQKKKWNKESYHRHKETAKEYNIKNKDKILNYNRNKEKQRRETLSERYVKKLLIEKNGFKKEQITKEIIEVKREIIKIKRL